MDVVEWQIDEDDAEQTLRALAQNSQLTDAERLNAEHALGTMNLPQDDAKTLVSRALEANTQGGRTKAVRSLTQKSPEHLVTVCRRARCSTTRLEAVSALRSFSSTGQISVELEALCADTDPQLRVTAFSALAQAPSTQYSVAKSWLSKSAQSDKNQQVLALVSLEKQGTETDLDLIGNFRTHDCGRVRAAAREAIRAIVSRETKKGARVSQTL